MILDINIFSYPSFYVLKVFISCKEFMIFKVKYVSMFLTHKLHLNSVSSTLNLR